MKKIGFKTFSSSMKETPKILYIIRLQLPEERPAKASPSLEREI